MAKKNSPAIFKELEIDITLLNSDFDEFAKQVNSAANSIRAYLKETPKTRSEKENEYRDELLHDDHAKARAKEILSAIRELLDDENDAVIAHVQKMLPQIGEDINNRLGLSAISIMREEHVDREWPDKRTAMLAYKALRDTYNSILELWNFSNHPKLPAVTGNYTDKSSLSIKEYRFIFNNTEYFNWYFATRDAGIRDKVKNLQDVLDLIAAGEANGLVAIELQS